MKKLPKQSEIFRKQRRNLMIFKTRSFVSLKEKEKNKRNKKIDFWEE